MVGGSSPAQGVKLLAPCPKAEEGMAEMSVVTYEGLFQFCMVLFTFAGMIIAIINNKK